MFTIFVSCRSNKFVPTVDTYKDHMKGMQIGIRLEDDSYVRGELIAINEEELYVLKTKLQKGENPHKIIKINDIQHANIMIYNKSTKLRVFKIFSALTYISNLFQGGLAILALPINLVVNSSVVGGAAGYNYVEYPTNISWKEIDKFARFPQGIPPEVEWEGVE